MYASVYRYAKEHDLTPVRYRAMRMPIAYLCIDEEGAYDRLDVVPKADRVKRLCPDIGKNRAGPSIKSSSHLPIKAYDRSS